MQPNNESKQPACTAVMDVSRLRNLASDDPEIIGEIVTLYMKESEGLLRRLETGVQSGMAKEVEQAAHRFAGASAACGMVAIVPCLRQLEDAGRTESLGGADAMFKRIEGEFEEIRKFVDREFPKSS